MSGAATPSAALGSPFRLESAHPRSSMSIVTITLGGGAAAAMTRIERQQGEEGARAEVRESTT